MSKAIFLDRDGVINKNPAEHDYVKRVEELEILPGVKEAVDLIKQRGYLVIVITNQRGVSRGMMTAEDVEKIHHKINEELGGRIDAFYVCYHGSEENCECRKPKPGLVERAVREWQIDLAESWMIGDTDADMETAENAGVRGIKIDRNGNLVEAVDRISGNNGGS